MASLDLPASTSNESQDGPLTRTTQGRNASGRSKPRKTRPRNVAVDRKAFMKALSANVSRQELWVNWLRSAAVERLKFQAEFVSIYFSKDGTRFSGFEYILKTAPDNPPLLHALDSLCLSHVGAVTKNTKLQEGARGSYGLSLAHLRRAIQDPNYDVSVLIAALHVLAICEKFSPIAATDGNGWRRHNRGLLQAVAACDIPKLAPEARAILAIHLRGQAIWDCMLDRTDLTGLANIQRAFHSGVAFGSSDEFLKIAICVPATLKSCSAICHRGSVVSADSVMDCFAALLTLEQCLREWMLSWYKTMHGQPYRRVPVQQSDEDSRLGLVFADAFIFPSSLEASQHRAYWVCQLLLSEAQADFQQEFADYLPDLSGAAGDAKRAEALIRTAAECADNLCMSIAFDIRPGNGFIAFHSGIVPLQIVSIWYKRQGDMPKLDWCRRTLKSFEAAGLRPADI